MAAVKETGVVPNVPQQISGSVPEMRKEKGLRAVVGDGALVSAAIGSMRQPIRSARGVRRWIRSWPR
jgi:hypothetical protein